MHVLLNYFMKKKPINIKKTICLILNKVVMCDFIGKPVYSRNHLSTAQIFPETTNFFCMKYDVINKDCLTMFN